MKTVPVVLRFSGRSSSSMYALVCFSPAGSERSTEHVVEVVGALDRQRRRVAGRIVGVAAHGDIDGDHRLAGGLQQAIVKTASGLRGRGPEQIAFETFGHGILDDLGLGRRTEVRVTS